MFVLEAMACKKAVLAFNLPFASEVITHGETGLLAKPRDIKDLTEGIELLASDKNLRLKLGQAASQYVRANHNWDIQSDKFLKIYEELINQKVGK
jgi:glycosyltransferase involved in cell wall biosynthesis